MNDPHIFLEIEAGFDLHGLEPGFYTVGCGHRFQRETVNACLGCCLPGDAASACFTGVLLPYFFHNVNNLMVGVVGNLDLASMFMPEAEKVAPKLAAARAATGSVVDFIRDISRGSIPSFENGISRTGLETTLTLIKAACGRSVSTEGLDSLDLESDIPSGDSQALLNVVRGMGVWCVLCMGGSGSLSGETAQGRLSLTWEKPPEAGRSHMPGFDSAPEMLSMAGGLAAAAGYRLVVENWTERGGTVTLGY